MDVRYINPFIESVSNLFSTMLATTLTVGKPVLQVGEVQADVSAMIGFSGDATGCVVLCFPIATATRAASAFAGIAMTERHEDFADAVGELANIVAGQAKAQLDGFDISISLPSVVVGKTHVVLNSRQRPRLAVPCTSVLGDFTVEVAMITRAAPAAAQPAGSTTEYAVA